MTPHKPEKHDPNSPRTVEVTDESLARIRAALADLRYGVVTIVVQDGVIVQIDRTEKVRLR